MIRVTLDSNIYLSALVFGGKPMQLLEMAVDGELEVAISDPIIEEVRRNLQTTFGWSDEHVAEAIGTMAAFTRRAIPTEIIDAVPSDPDDNRVLECAVAAGSEIIVTGDSDLLRLGTYGSIRILKAAELLSAPGTGRP